MHRGLLITAAVLGACSVVLGAFGAHALKEMVSDDALDIFDTAVNYQFYHVFALLFTGLLFSRNKRLMIWAGRFFIFGVILFCGSLYGLTFIEGFQLSGFSWVGPITPLGGLCFITGWVLLAVALIKSDSIFAIHG